MSGSILRSSQVGFVFAKIPITCLSGKGGETLSIDPNLLTPPLPYDGEREHTECAALTCPARDGSHARVAFSIVKNNRKQWIGARDHFLHLQVALFARLKYRPRGQCGADEESERAGFVCPRIPIRVSFLRAAVAQLPVKNRPERGGRRQPSFSTATGWFFVRGRSSSRAMLRFSELRSWCT